VAQVELHPIWGVDFSSVSSITLMRMKFSFFDKNLRAPRMFYMVEKCGRFARGECHAERSEGIHILLSVSFTRFPAPDSRLSFAT